MNADPEASESRIYVLLGPSGTAMSEGPDVYVQRTDRMASDRRVLYAGNKYAELGGQTSFPVFQKKLRILELKKFEEQNVPNIFVEKIHQLDGFLHLGDQATEVESIDDLRLGDFGDIEAQHLEFGYF